MPAVHASRTLNPLHFEDLEPHRFEDLVRQLAYDFRPWKKIEATGRQGSDDGLDVRAIEGVRDDESADDEGDAAPPVSEDRVWIIQCKRERELGPKRVREVVEESLLPQTPTPHGFIIAAACDFSKRARDAFRDEMVARKVGEFYLWGKADLEDMLVQPKNDHLLFAYFNVSLQVRRRTLRTEVRSRVALKKQLVSVLGDALTQHEKPLLIRDPREDRYPYSKDVPGFEARPQWFRAFFLHAGYPDHLALLVRKHLAYISSDRTHWDAILAYNALPHLIRTHDHQSIEVDDAYREYDRHREFWQEYVPAGNRVWLECVRLLPLDRVLGIDPHGDFFNPGLQLLVEFRGADGPFDRREVRHLVVDGHHQLLELKPTPESRTTFFPERIPETLFPPPPGLRGDLATPISPLNDVAAAGLERALARCSQFVEATTRRVEAPVQVDYHAAERADVAAFRRVCEEVIEPVFAAFVRRLEAANRGARIARVPVETHDDFRPHERHAIELRVALGFDVYFAGGFGGTAHLRLAFVPGRNVVEIDREPEPARRSGAVRVAEALPLEAVTRERVEAETLRFLESLLPSAPAT